MNNAPTLYLASAKKLIALLVYAVGAFDVDETAESGHSSGERFRNMCEWLEHRDVCLLGQGHFAAVFTHASIPGLVVKYSFGNEDTALTYLAYARAHPGPHMPKVYHLERFDDHFVAVLDELTSIERVEYEESCLYDGGWKSHKGSLAVALRDVAVFFRGASTVDMHRANVMKDNEGNWVLTDPISFCKSRLLCTGIERAYGVESTDDIADDDD